MRTLSTHQSYLFRYLATIPAVINFLLNGTIALILFQSLEVVPLWGMQSINADTLSTTFFLPFFTYLGITPLIRRELSLNHIHTINLPQQICKVLIKVPDKTIIRALVVGILSFFILGPVSLFIVSSLKIIELGFWNFIIFKAIFATGLGFLVTPLIGLWILGDSRTENN